MRTFRKYNLLYCRCCDWVYPDNATNSATENITDCPNPECYYDGLHLVACDTREGIEQWCKYRGISVPDWLDDEIITEKEVK